MNINHVTIVGRLTADPELRSTGGGQPVLAIGIATNRTFTDKTGQKQEEVEFHSVVIFGRQAEIAAQFSRKGSLLGIEGRLRTRVWADKKGDEHKTTEIICEQLHLGPGGSTKATKPSLDQPKKDDVRIVPEEPGLSGDEDDTGRNMSSLFGDEKEEIKTEDIPF